mgnify:CR=1 FL=1
MLILDGKIASAAVKATLLAQTQALTIAGKRAPHLAAILVGNNGASETYVASKVKNCEETGFESTLVRLDADVSEKILLDKIIELNNNPNINISKWFSEKYYWPKLIDGEYKIEFYALGNSVGKALKVSKRL